MEVARLGGSVEMVLDVLIKCARHSPRSAQLLANACIGDWPLIIMMMMVKVVIAVVVMVVARLIVMVRMMMRGR